MKPFVIFGTPALYGEVGFGYVGSLLQATYLMTQEGMNWGSIMIPGDPYLAKVRNTIITKFLNDHPEATHLFFIDADLGFTPSAVMTLINADLDVCCGIYPKKSDAIEFPCELELNRETEQVIEHPEKPGFFKARSIPTGFLCIKREVLERMIKGRGVYLDLDGKYRRNCFQMGFCVDVAEGESPKFDDSTGEQIGSWWGEDYAFAKQWHDMGGEIWVYANIDFSHTGLKSWKNNFAGSVSAFREGRAKVREVGDPPLQSAA